MGDVLLLVNHDRGQILDKVDQLATLDFMRDTKLVCQDGTLRWSALLLSQWSRLVRRSIENYGIFTPDSPLVIMLPETKAKVIDQLLRWSVTGELKATNREIRETTTALLSLGVSVKFSQEFIVSDDVSPVKKQRPNPPSTSSSASENTCRISISSNDSRMVTSTSIDPQSIKEEDMDLNGIDADDRGDEQAEEGIDVNDRGDEHAEEGIDVNDRGDEKAESVDADVTYDQVEKDPDYTESPLKKHGSKKYKCPLCPYSVGVSARLVFHICTQHYSKELLTFWNSKSLLTPCPVCNKVLVTNPQDHKKRKIFKVCVHLGSTHDKLKSVANDKVRKMLKQMNFFPSQSEASRREWLGCAAQISTLHKTCQTCMTTTDANTLMVHLAHVHYAANIVERLGGSEATACKLCGEEFETMRCGDRTFGAVAHSLNSHTDVVYDELPQKLAKSLEICFSSPGHLSLESQLDVSGGTSELFDKWSCPMCDTCLAAKNELKHHLCIVHFQKDLLEMVEIKDLSTCPICGSQRRSPSQRRYRLAQSMAAHLGKTHGGLSRVMTEEQRAKLEKMGLYILPPDEAINHNAKEIPTDDCS